jgi:HEAT repeat protein
MWTNLLRTPGLPLLGLLAGIAALLAGCAGEPRYHGKKLDAWIAAYRDAQEASPAEREAEAAVRAIGTNGLPCLTAWVVSKDPSLADQGRYGLRILGAEAAPAVPVLAPLLTGTNDLVALSASLALATIGAPAVPTLMNALTNKDYRISLNASLALTELGTNAGPAIPFLLEELKHPDRRYRERAAATLSGLNIEPDVVVPALTEMLHDPSQAARFHAITGLGDFGPRARSATPQLIDIMEHDQVNGGLRNVAKAALLKIAPEVLTNAPPQ